jgi:hypothetical protein
VWLLHIAAINRPVIEIGIGHLGELIDSEFPCLSDHERDAALGAVAASAMMNKRSGWRALFHGRTPTLAHLGS